MEMVTRSKRMKETQQTKRKKTATRPVKAAKPVLATRARVSRVKRTGTKAEPVIQPPVRPSKYIAQEIEKKWQMV